MLGSIAGLFAITMFAAPEPRGIPSGVVLIVLAAVGALILVLSFAVKRKILERSVEKQDVMLVQQALVVAWAMCEASALLGVVERFVIGSGDHYLLFLIAAVGIALHVPRRNQLLSATWKDQSGKGAF
jgi:hypothetical protein